MAGVQRSEWPRRWLWLGVMALALAGMFSVVLVIARTPQLQALALFEDLFHVALVVHVDLSVLVWFLAMSGFLWAILRARSSTRSLPYFDSASWWCMMLGMLMVAASPLYPEWETLKSNYIPVITNIVFFLGIALVMCSVLISCLHSLVCCSIKGAAILDQGMYGGAVVALIALLAFVATPFTLNVPLQGLAKFETLFWAGGHIMQFTYTQSMLVAWCVMAILLGYQLPSNRLLGLLFLVGPLAAVSSVYPYMEYDTHSQEHMDFFTKQMIMAGGVSGGLLGPYLLISSLRANQSPKELRAVRGCFIMSLLLFVVGGVFGVAIDGPNVRIPAHYHGSIVAVTLALMGVAYATLPAFGYSAVSHTKMARVQPYLYGFGQLLHIGGLAWSGGYGVLRKTAGDIGDGAWQVKMALGIMGGGGLLAIVGGLLFVIVMVRAYRQKRGKDLPG